LLLAERRCREVMARYGFTVALLPLDWPLGQILERDPEWRVAYRDSQAVLLVRSDMRGDTQGDAQGDTQGDKR
jgi:hypothetical protein